jgi:hypothetical protein
LADRLDHTFERRLRLGWARLRHDRYTANGLDQMTQAGGTALGYDAKGNLEQIGGAANGYIAENRLRSAPGVSDILAGPSGVHLLPKRGLPEVRRQPHDRRAYFPDSIAS